MSKSFVHLLAEASFHIWVGVSTHHLLLGTFLQKLLLFLIVLFSPAKRGLRLRYPGFSFIFTRLNSALVHSATAPPPPHHAAVVICLWAKTCWPNLFYVIVHRHPLPWQLIGYSRDYGVGQLVRGGVSGSGFHLVVAHDVTRKFEAGNSKPDGSAVRSLES